MEVIKMSSQDMKNYIEASRQIFKELKLKDFQTDIILVAIAMYHEEM